MEGEFTDHRIPEGSHIHKLKLFYYKEDSLLVGLKFFDKNERIILNCGNYLHVYNKNKEINL
jgi:hypothetical protein